MLQVLARKDYAAVARGVEADYQLDENASALFRPAVDCIDSLHAGIVAYGALRKVIKARQLATRRLSPLQQPHPTTLAFLLLAYVDADRLDLVEDLLLQWLRASREKGRETDETADTFLAYLTSVRATAPAVASPGTTATLLASEAIDAPTLISAIGDTVLPPPPPAVWAAVARGYAHRGAWAPCLLVADVALSRLSSPPRANAPSWRAAADRCVGLAVRTMGHQGEIAAALRLAMRAASGAHGLSPRVADLAHVLNGWALPTHLLDGDAEAGGAVATVAATAATAAVLLSHVDALLDVVVAQARREQKHHVDTANRGRAEPLTSTVPELVVTARGAVVRRGDRETVGDNKAGGGVDLGAARALASALVTALCRQGRVAEAERAALRLAEAGVAREALSPAAVATLIHGLCLHPDGDHRGGEGGGARDTSMARADTLFAYLAFLATDTSDAVLSAAARRARAMAYHHICDGYRRRNALPALTHFVEQHMTVQ